MKIYAKHDADPELTEWGIFVPLLKSRALKICEALDGDSELKGKVGLLSPYLLSKDDIRLAGHEEKFVDSIFSNKDELIDPILMETYELFKSDGSFHRFDPKLKNRRFHELFMCQLAEASNSYQCAVKALKDKGQVFYLSGGMHHAMSFGEPRFLSNKRCDNSNKKAPERKADQNGMGY